MTLPLPAYIAAVEAITPLPDSAICWAMESCHGGIPPWQFAYWLSLTASSSLLPQPSCCGLIEAMDLTGVLVPSVVDARMKGNPHAVHESRMGEQIQERSIA